MAWTDPRTWVAGETVTAALLNAHVRDNLKAIGDAWTAYTPTLSQGASTNIAKTVTYAKYLSVGKLVIGQVRVASTATGTAGSAITLSLPVTAATTGLVVGSGFYVDNGTGWYPGVAAYLVSTGTIVLLRADTAGAGTGVGVDPAITVASGDVFAASFMYEAA